VIAAIVESLAATFVRPCTVVCLRDNKTQRLKPIPQRLGAVSKPILYETGTLLPFAVKSRGPSHAGN